MEAIGLDRTPGRQSPPKSGILRADEANFALTLLVLVTRWGNVVAELELEVMLLLAAGIEALRLICRNTPLPMPRPPSLFPMPPAKSVRWKSAHWKQRQPHGLLRDH